MPRVHVCQVLHSLDYGGTERLAVRLAKSLQQDFMVSFILLDARGPLADDVETERTKVYILGRKPGWDLGCARQLRQVWLDIRPDVIVAHQYTPFVYSSLARGWSRKPPILYVEHGRFYPDCRRLRRVMYNRLIWRKSDRIVAVGQAIKKALVQNEGFSPQDVTVVYNGIDVSRFQEKKSERDSVRRFLGLGQDTIAVLYVARFDPLKDHMTAIRAMKHLHDLPVRLILVGDGPTKAEVEQCVVNYGFSERVLCLGYRTDIPELIAAADIFLLTSLNEGIPVAVLEAMAAGLPVVATRVGGVPEIVEDGKTGLLVEPGDEHQVADAIRQLARNPLYRRYLGQNGYERVRKEFSEEHMHDRYRIIIQELVAHQRNLAPTCWRAGNLCFVRSRRVVE